MVDVWNSELNTQMGYSNNEIKGKFTITKENGYVSGQKVLLLVENILSSI